MTILQAYDLLAIPGILLLVYVRDKAPHDEACKRDATWLRWARHVAFTLTALAFCYSVLDEMSQLSMFLLVASALGLVGVNALVLHLRERKISGPSVRFDIAARARARRPG